MSDDALEEMARKVLGFSLTERCPRHTEDEVRRPRREDILWRRIVDDKKNHFPEKERNFKRHQRIAQAILKKDEEESKNEN